MSIEFSNGFTLIPNGYNPIAEGDYYLIADYRPALFDGDITIPDHPNNNTYSLDFNIVGGTYGAGIYINLNDKLGNDNSAYLNQLVGNHTHLTFSQGTYHITFDCEATAWSILSNMLCYDPTQSGSPLNTISIVSTSGQPFNDVDQIGILIEII